MNPLSSPHPHFAARLEERFGSDLCALAVWDDLVDAFAGHDWDKLRLVTRLGGVNRVYRMDLADGRPLFAVFDCDAGIPVTVMTEGMEVSAKGRGKVVLSSSPPPTWKWRKSKLRGRKAT